MQKKRSAKIKNKPFLFFSNIILYLKIGRKNRKNSKKKIKIEKKRK